MPNMPNMANMPNMPNMPNMANMQQQENIDYNTVYANQLDRLTEMGFPNREHNLRLLIQTMGDIDRVIELLFR